ncbi:MAG: TolC family protein [Planctomycetaceae bacterium]
MTAPLLAALVGWSASLAAQEAEWQRGGRGAMGLPSGTVPLAVAPVDPAAPEPTTLEEFVALAERGHPRLLAARAAIEAARGKAVQSRLYPNPVIAGFSPQMAGPDSQWSGTVAQDIVTGGKLRLQQQAALRDVQRAEYELVRARFDVLRGVRAGYYNLLVAQRRLEIYKLLLDISTRSYDIGRQLAEAGEGTKADVLFWSIERDRAEVRLLNATVFIETGRRELAAAVGLPRADVGRLDGDLFRELPNFDLKQLQEAVVRSNALPRAAEARISGNQWALERATVQPIPNVNLMGGYQRQVEPGQDQGLAQVMMAVPLFDRNQGNIRAARADIALARADLRSLELDLATQTAEAVATYRSAQRAVDWFEEYILPKARETVTLTQTLYARGEVTFLSLLQAQKILTETELAYVDSQAERWTGAVAIADLLQLEQFPPDASAPAALPMDDDAAAVEDVDAPAAKRPPAAAPAPLEPPPPRDAAASGGAPALGRTPPDGPAPRAPTVPTAPATPRAGPAPAAPPRAIGPVPAPAPAPATGGAADSGGRGLSGILRTGWWPRGGQAPRR